MGDQSSRDVAKTTVEDFYISTVFLVINHNMTGNGPPILFETMIFYKGDGKHGLDGEMMRASTFEEAETHHRELVELCEMEVQLS
jgi:hypothetical protein